MSVGTPDPTDCRPYDSFRTCSELKTDGILVGLRSEWSAKRRTSSR